MRCVLYASSSALLVFYFVFIDVHAGGFRTVNCWVCIPNGVDQKSSSGSIYRFLPFVFAHPLRKTAPQTKTI